MARYRIGIAGGLAGAGVACGAMRRSRKVGDPEVLLRLILLHVAGGLSLLEARVRSPRTGSGNPLGCGVAQALARCWGLASRVELELTKHSWSALHRPVLPASCRLRAIDASDVQEPGATGTPKCEIGFIVRALDHRLGTKVSVVAGRRRTQSAKKLTGNG
jgi:hypothetical protein